MPTVLYDRGWRLHFYSNEGSEPMHIHASKGGAECKYWLLPERFDIIEEFEHNCTPRLRREVRQVIFQHFDQVVSAWREHFGGIVSTKTSPLLARAIELTGDALVVVTDTASVAIPWEECSERLAHASAAERNQAHLSPSGYGIHWPLLDEDLAVGPLIRARVQSC